MREGELAMRSTVIVVVLALYAVLTGCASKSPVAPATPRRIPSNVSWRPTPYVEPPQPLRLAAQALRQGRPEDAESLLQPLLIHRDNGLEARWLMAIAQWRGGRHEAARATLAPLSQQPEWAERATLLIAAIRFDEGQRLAASALWRHSMSSGRAESWAVAAAQRAGLFG